MTNLTENPLPAFNVDDDGNWAALALCVFDIETRACIHCGGTNVWATYAEYVEHFWAHEYEGDSWHAPDDEADFDRTFSLCLATAAENADDSAVVR